MSLSDAETPPPNVSAASVLDEADLPGPAILLPVTSKTGVAAFSRGGEAHIVLDRPQAIDLSPLKDSVVFGNMTETILSNGTDLRFPVRPAAPLHLVQHGGNWAVSLSPLIPPSSSIPMTGRMRAGILVFNLKSPGRNVVLDDEVTGTRMVVVTQHEEGQRVTSRHLGAELAIPPTWLGLVVEPTSDRLVMRTTRAGLEISTSDTPALASVWPEQTSSAWPDGRLMTHIFGFADQSADGQGRRLHQALQDAATLPKTARYAARLRVAQAMLAEGLDAEAAAVVRVATTDDPRHRNDPLAVGLAAVAAWLSAEAGGTAPPSSPPDSARLGESDEATMWRALLQADLSDTSRQAAALAATWPLMLEYPPGLRRFMLRPAAALLASGGQEKALGAFLAAFSDPSLDLDRASYLQSHGKIDEGLALLGRVSQGADRLARAEAVTLALHQKLQARQLAPAKAANELEKSLYAWRGDGREMKARQFLAQLYAQAGAWRKALAELNDTEAMFPSSADTLHESEATIIDNLLHGDQAAKLNALDLVNLAAQAAKLSSTIDQDRFAPLLAEKLLALDLPQKAEPILRDLLSRSRSAQSKAEIGAQLAELQAGRGDGNAALATLDTSSASGLTPAILASRALLRGRLLASTGKTADALTLLSSQPGQKARELEVTIMEAKHDWLGAADVLSRTLNTPDFAALPDASQQDILIHDARDRSEAGDRTGLRQLRQAYAARFRSSANATLFAVLTADPVQNTTDLPRSASEITEMRALPASLSQSAP